MAAWCTRWQEKLRNEDVKASGMTEALRDRSWIRKRRALRERFDVPASKRDAIASCDLMRRAF
jgi:hypothetical protein